MIKFEIGKQYVYIFLSDGNYEVCVMYECVSRTEKTVTLKDEYGQLNRKKLERDHDSEYVRINYEIVSASKVYDPELYPAPMYI